MIINYTLYGLWKTTLKYYFSTIYESFSEESFFLLEGQSICSYLVIKIKNSSERIDFQPLILEKEKRKRINAIIKKHIHEKQGTIFVIPYIYN